MVRIFVDFFFLFLINLIKALERNRKRCERLVCVRYARPPASHWTRLNVDSSCDSHQSAISSERCTRFCIRSGCFKMLKIGIILHLSRFSLGACGIAFNRVPARLASRLKRFSVLPCSTDWLLNATQSEFNSVRWGMLARALGNHRTCPRRAARAALELLLELSENNLNLLKFKREKNLKAPLYTRIQSL